MNSFIETIQTAFGALLLNKVRSFLTMLGVIIGVFAVVTLVSMVQGFKNYVTDQFNALGSNLLFVVPGKAGAGRDPAQAATSNKLDAKHVDLIRNYDGKNIAEVDPYYELSAIATYKSNNYAPQITGTSEKAKSIFNISMSQGDFFTSADVKSKSRVVVLGPEVVKQLFGNENPVGKRISIRSAAFDVLGVFKSKGSNFDNIIYMPESTAKEFFDLKNISSIVLKVKPNADVNEAKSQVRFALLRDLKKDDFTVMSQEDILSSVQSILGIISIGLGAIGGISLLVGGIGIMNIMLVSVTERIREIGLRKALGATSINIALQFMLESIMLSVTGGLIGLFLAWLATRAVQNIVRAEVPPWAVVIGLGFSVAIGVIFGTYPAVSASKKDAIEALQFE